MLQIFASPYINLISRFPKFWLQEITCESTFYVVQNFDFWLPVRV